MNLDDLKGKTVVKVNSGKRIDIIFQDGIVLKIFGSYECEKPEILPWIDNEKSFIATLSETDRKLYSEVRKAFFWLIDNYDKVLKHYSFFDKHWRETRSQFSVEIDMKKNDPEGILTIFFSSHIAPECDNWFVLGKKRDWKYIIEMYKQVNTID